jgi:hypothetical protein
MKLAIIGSREFGDEQLAENVFCNHFFQTFGNTLEIISGDCYSGGDKIGKDLARKYKLKYIGYPAKWNDLTLTPCKIGIKNGRKYNILAGFNRNKDIIENSEMVLAFWNGSGGTKDSLEIAKNLKKPTFIVYF